MSQKIFETVKSLAAFHSTKIRIKLVFYSLLTGILTGFVVSMYTKSLTFIQLIRKDLFSNFTGIRFFFIAVLFVLISILLQLIINKYPLISGSGIPQVMALIKDKINFNWLPELFFKFFGGVSAIFLGFSLGREGPSIHLGALIGDAINTLTKRSEIEKKYIITCGASAGLAAAFNAPLAGAIFAIEELHKFFSPILLICVLLSSMFGNLISKFILGNELSFHKYSFLSPIDYSLKNICIHLVLIIILSLLMVILAKLFNYSLIKFSKIYKSLKLNNYVKLSIYSLISLLVILYIPKISGGGHSLIESLLEIKLSSKILLFLLIFKFLFTMFSYSTSLPGGIFLPILVIGALSGKLYGQVLTHYFNFDFSFSTLYVLIAMTSFFTAVVRSPITGIILILEMSGNFSNLFVLVLASTISYATSELLKQESIYELLFHKSFEKKEKLNKNSIVTMKIPVLRNSYVTNKMIKDIDWPENLLIVGIERDGRIEVIPNGDTLIQELDFLILLTDSNTEKINRSKILDLTNSI